MSIKMSSSSDTQMVTVFPRHISDYISNDVLNHSLKNVLNYTCDFDYPCLYHIGATAQFDQQPTIKEINRHSNMSGNITGSSRHHASMKKAIKYINGRLTENVSLNDVAEHIKLSPCYFSKLFKKQFGIGFNLYINQQRMKQAKLLLDMSELSIATIAKNLGFSQVSYFCRLFKQTYQMTPQNYRNQSVGR